MGFGILFIGYLLFLNPFNFYLLAPAAFIMSLGLKRLALYDRHLSTAYLISHLLMIEGLLFILLGVLSGTGLIPSVSFVRNILTVATYFSLCLFYYALFSGIMDLAAETGLPGIRFRAYRNRIFSVAFSLLSIPLEFTLPTAVFRVITVPVLLLSMVIVFLNLMLIYSCYMRICRPEDADIALIPEKDDLLTRMKKSNERNSEHHKKR